MSIEESIRFAQDVQRPGALRDALERIEPGDPERRLSALLAVAAEHGYTFSADDYFHASQAQASAAQASPPPDPAQQAIVTYTQYGIPYSAFPPIPPPMPT